MLTPNRVFSEAQSLAQEQKNRMMDLTFLSKGQLRKQYELLWLENQKLREPKPLGKIEFNEESFVKVTQENLRLQKELNDALKTILEFNRELNAEFKKELDTSPHLKIA